MKLSVIVLCASFLYSMLSAQDINITSKSITADLKETRVLIRRSPFEQGDFELSMLGNAGKESLKSTYAGITFDDQSYEYVSLNFCLGYYILDGLSIEPEVDWFAQEDVTPSISGTLNLSYTQRIPESIIAPFVRIGYGFGNTIFVQSKPDFPYIILRSGTVRLVNLGAGIKISISPDVIVRTELKYKNESDQESDDFHTTHTNLGLYFGFSILI